MQLKSNPCSVEGSANEYILSDILLTDAAS